MMEPVAVVGMACRFPQADDPQAFWRLLAEGREAIREVPPDRWDVDALYDPSPAAPGKTTTRWGGFLDNVDKFDADFFRFSAFEAERMDPQQRFMLELTWEALEDAGIVPAALAGSRTGVFVGISHSDYDRIIYKDLARISPIHGISTYHCIAANRVSYTYDLRGPSLAVDTACSSALVALHYACQSLRTGECDVALVGGVNLMLSPEETIGLSKSGIMAPDGRCKTFDRSADGYVRGEGCGVLVLKRLADANRDSDRILALVRGSAVNQSGLTNGLGAPSAPAQQALIRQALAAAGVQPAQIDYVEAQGLGTALGDQTEVRAIKAVLGSGRDAARRCYIGSVKTNIGHLEAASGMAGLIKTILALQHEHIPPHRNLNDLNPHIALANTPFAIPTEGAPWPATDTPRRAAVTAMGFGGTNAQAIVEEAPRAAAPASGHARPWHVVTLSAKSEAALRDLARRYRAYLAEPACAPLGDIAFTTNVGRTHFEHRLAIAADSLARLRARLDGFLEGRTADVLYGHAPPRRASRTVFVFDADGACARAAWRALADTETEFRRAFDACDAIYRRCRAPSDPPALADRLAALAAADAAEAAAVFAVQYALAALWRHWGMKPAAAVGEGVCEHVAACIDGTRDLDATIESLLRAPVEATSAPSHVAAAARALAAQGSTDFLYVTAGAWRRGLDTTPEGPWSWAAALHSLGAAYVSGAAIEWAAFHAESVHRKVALPTYPFQRRRYWFEFATELAQSAAAPAAAVDAVVVELQRGRRGEIPLFLVHPIQGSVLCYRDLVRHLGSSRPVYGLQAPVLGGGDDFDSIEAMAASYVACVRRVQPKGALHLAGWSMGGIVAFEMAQQLRTTGEAARLALIDAPLPGPALDREVRSLLGPLGAELGLDEAALQAEMRRGDDIEQILARLLAAAGTVTDGTAGAEADRAADSAELARRLALIRRHIQLLHAYRPTRYDGRLVVIQAEATTNADGDSDRVGWREQADSVTAYRLAGDHYTLLRAPAAAALAGLLRRELFDARDVSPVELATGTTDDTNTPAPAQAARIEHWARAWLARVLGTDPAAIDPDADLADFGVSSISAARFLKELSDWLGIAVTPAIAWRYSTVSALAAYLARGAPDETAEPQATRRSQAR